MRTRFPGLPDAPRHCRNRDAGGRPERGPSPGAAPAGAAALRRALGSRREGCGGHHGTEVGACPWRGRSPPRPDRQRLRQRTPAVTQEGELGLRRVCAAWTPICSEIRPPGKMMGRPKAPLNKCRESSAIRLPTGGTIYAAIMRVDLRVKAVHETDSSVWRGASGRHPCRGGRCRSGGRHRQRCHVVTEVERADRCWPANAMYPSPRLRALLRAGASLRRSHRNIRFANDPADHARRLRNNIARSWFSI